MEQPSKTKSKTLEIKARKASEKRDTHRSYWKTSIKSSESVRRRDKAKTEVEEASKNPEPATRAKSKQSIYVITDNK